MRLLALLLLALLCGAAPARAQAYACLVAADPIAFAAVDPLDPAATDAVGAVHVSCTLIGVVAVLVSYDISLSPGNSGDVNARSLVSGLNALSYNLYRDAGHTQIWGDVGAGQGVSDGYLLDLGTVNRDYSVYGRIPGGQSSAPPGIYADVITVRVDY